jgi:hypothetical protein
MKNFCCFFICFFVVGFAVCLEGIMVEGVVCWREGGVGKAADLDDGDAAHDAPLGPAALTQIAVALLLVCGGAINGVCNQDAEALLDGLGERRHGGDGCVGLRLFKCLLLGSVRIAGGLICVRPGLAFGLLGLHLVPPDALGQELAVGLAQLVGVVRLTVGAGLQLAEVLHLGAALLLRTGGPALWMRVKLGLLLVGKALRLGDHGLISGDDICGWLRDHAAALLTRVVHEFAEAPALHLLGHKGGIQHLCGAVHFVYVCVYENGRVYVPEAYGADSN